MQKSFFPLVIPSLSRQTHINIELVRKLSSVVNVLTVRVIQILLIQAFSDHLGINIEAWTGLKLKRSYPFQTLLHAQTYTSTCTDLALLGYDLTSVT